MRRPRKGDVFRPPTAADSAANADALEGFRRRPALPEGRLPRGTPIVKTPGAGIPARNGTTFYSAECNRCVETSTAGTKTILETDEPLLVYNLADDAVDGGIYALTRLGLGGTLFITRRCCGPEETCQNCLDDASVTQVLIEISGFDHTDCGYAPLSWCDDINGGHTLTTSPESPGCQWIGPAVVTCWDVLYPTATVIFDGNYKVVVRVEDLTFPFDGGTIWWIKNYGASKPDCAAWNQEDIPFGGEAFSTCTAALLDDPVCLLTSL